MELVGQNPLRGPPDEMGGDSYMERKSHSKTADQKFCSPNSSSINSPFAMVSFVCESCQDTIKKPKLKAVGYFGVYATNCSMHNGVMDRLLVLIVILLFKDELGRVIQVVLPRNRSIRRAI